MSEWKEYKLGEVSKIQTGPFGSQLHASDYVVTGIPSIMPTNIGQRLDIRTDQIVYVDPKDIERLKKYKVLENDIVYSRRGDVEKCAFITEQQEGWLCGTGCLRIRFSSPEVLPKFVAYYLSTPDIKSWVLNSAVGTTMPNLNSGILTKLPLRVPEKKVQVQISNTLSSLDDKIDLLHRQNKTLESMAETLFRQWFVEEAEEKVKLGDYVKTSSGGTPSRSNLDYYANGTVKWVKSKELKGNFIFDTEEKITDEAVKNSSAKLFPSNTVLIAMYGATVGEYALLAEPSTCNQAICGLIPNENMPYTFLFTLIKLNKENLIALAGGSAQQNISQELIKEFEIPYSKSKIDKFHNTTDPFFQKIKSNTDQTEKLKLLREALLPKLMSGEIQLS
ncbi:restriction endonuclease subunit S [Dyadobacter psychrotolerans]|uniref:Restriction endonuclease subunit S n=1 Tax=Dyadobacter psychrotolerans TaxID=2541721 RepID=A0A4R5E0L0_9BACT|nr:restriction endonuclease subunit S [Dyadobacter psychrotolerans]TDE18061.1 restriction endonuclease subunit S [Dyadobacter psychrotolerans]